MPIAVIYIMPCICNLEVRKHESDNSAPEYIIIHQDNPRKKRTGGSNLHRMW